MEKERKKTNKISVKGIEKHVFTVCTPVHKNHRINTERKEKVGGDSSSLKVSLTDACRTVPCQYNGWGMPGRWAGSPIAVYTRVQCREPKTEQEKVQFYCEDDSLFLSFYYLSLKRIFCNMLKIRIFLKSRVYKTFFQQ